MMNKGMIRVLLAALFFISLANPTSAAPPTMNTLNQHTIAQLIESETVGVGEDVVIHIDNNIPPNVHHLYGLHDLEANDQVMINITFTPTIKSIRLGVCNEKRDWCAWGLDQSDGKASDQFFVSTTGKYHAIIYNPSNETLHYKGHYRLK